nr:MAG TPA: hypothetical protein [Caudoviricetes sp.]
MVSRVLITYQSLRTSCTNSMTTASLTQQTMTS